MRDPNPWVGRAGGQEGYPWELLSFVVVFDWYMVSFVKLGWIACVGRSVQGFLCWPFQMFDPGTENNFP